MVSEQRLGEMIPRKLEADIAKLNKHVNDKFGKMEQMFTLMQEQIMHISRKTTSNVGESKASPS